LISNNLWVKGRASRSLDIPERAAPAAKAKVPDDEEELEALTDDDGDDWIDSSDN